MFKALFRSLWGSQESRGFKIAAWGTAIGAFSAWSYFSASPPKVISHEEKAKKQ
jgi:hypothetical protein